MSKKKDGKTKIDGEQETGAQNGTAPQEKHGTMENLRYWLKALYRESPGFVWLYLAGIGATIGISLLGVYMPSVLVEDITKGKSVESILEDLAILGGGLVCLYLLNNWLEHTKTIYGSWLGQKQALQTAKSSLETTLRYMASKI